LEFNQAEERKPVSSLMNFALIGQNLKPAAHDACFPAGLFAF